MKKACLNGVRIIQDTVDSIDFIEDKFYAKTNNSGTFYGKVAIGAFGKRDEHYLREMREAGVNLNNIALLETESGHAVVMVDNETGENQIVLSGSANNKISKKQIESALSNAKTTDWALAQNETS